MKFRITSSTSLKELATHLNVVFKDINFLENFTSFQVVDQTIAAGAELRVTNRLNVIPTTMVVNKQTGNGLITASDTEWTKDYIYIKNNGASSVTATITFIR